MKVPWVRSGVQPLMRSIRQRHPPFKEAVFADMQLERRARGDDAPLTSRTARLIEVARLALVSDAFGALVLYRFKASCQRRNVPVVPRVAHRVAIAWAQLSIGDPVLIHPGVRFPHGQVVIDGFVEIHSGAQIRPFVVIGLREGEYQGPTVHRFAEIGTGAKILGPVTIGERARVGANAVVVHDVAPGSVVVGVPARPVG